MSGKATTQHLDEVNMPVEKTVTWFGHTGSKFTIKIDSDWLTQALTAKSCGLYCLSVWWRIGITRALIRFQKARGQHIADGHNQLALVYASHQLEARPLGRPCPRVESLCRPWRFCAIFPLPRFREATRA